MAWRLHRVTPFDPATAADPRARQRAAAFSPITQETPRFAAERGRRVEMTLRSATRATIMLATALATSALPAFGQTVTYSTSGVFSGGTGTTTCTATQCTSGGFALSFANAPVTSYTAPSLVDLGQFVTAFAVNDGTAGFTAFTGVNFTLTINQTGPTGGSSTFADGITGSLAYNPSASTLVWTPSSTSTSIGSVSYHLVTDASGNVGIQAPATNGQNPNPTSVKANIAVASTVPEPATGLLLAPGLAGLAFTTKVRRRRRSPSA
jgi:hypothetical protein